jgi:S-DNA-T family DNA segregation ATPase FtsK/SpoIIIE
MDAIELVIDSGKASVSMLQRRFRIGYNRAARIVDIMEDMGVVGPQDGSSPRQVIMTREEFEQLQNSQESDGEQEMLF